MLPHAQTTVQVAQGGMYRLPEPDDLSGFPLDMETWGCLLVLGSPHVIRLAGQDSFTLGRVMDDDQAIAPDIDLSPYQAYAHGVSRLHACIKRVGQHTALNFCLSGGKSVRGPVVLDLNSSNGTYVNDGRIAPHVEYVLSHGDVVAFGKLRMQVSVAFGC